MGMYSLTEDERSKAMEAVNCWHETPEAQALIEKIEAFERCSDRWYGEAPEVARAFSDMCVDVENELDNLRRAAVNAAADTYSNDQGSDEWLDAWESVEEDAPPIKQVLRAARRSHAGDDYLRRFSA